MVRPVVLASGNRGKLRELARVLDGLPVRLFPQSDAGVEPPEETGLTFVENAIIKARHASSVAGTAAVADDSGLEVDILEGAPGVHSARYAGPAASDGENVARLLAALDGVAAADRTARFRCVLVYLRHPRDATPVICDGTWEGRILEAPRGAGGFGYDPVFEVPGAGQTAAELAPGDKDRLSHRGQALRKLRAYLEGAGGLL